MYSLHASCLFRSSVLFPRFGCSVHILRSLRAWPKGMSVAVSGVATGNVEVLIGISRRVKQLCLNALVLHVGLCVLKCDCLRVPSGSEFDGSVVSVQIA